MVGRRGRPAPVAGPDPASARWPVHTRSRCRVARCIFLTHRGAMADKVLSKVPAVTLTFWIIKILATTLGETGGDTVSMTMDIGYLAATGIFLTALVVLVVLQIAA